VPRAVVSHPDDESLRIIRQYLRAERTRLPAVVVGVLLHAIARGLYVQVQSMRACEGHMMRHSIWDDVHGCAQSSETDVQEAAAYGRSDAKDLTQGLPLHARVEVVLVQGEPEDPVRVQGTRPYAAKRERRDDEGVQVEERADIQRHGVAEREVDARGEQRVPGRLRWREEGIPGQVRTVTHRVAPQPQHQDDEEDPGTHDDDLCTSPVSDRLTAKPQSNITFPGKTQIWASGTKRTQTGLGIPNLTQTLPKWKSCTGRSRLRSDGTHI
jgi:hypothetical protein